ncbi:MAG: hypothetical protein ABGY96_21250, partial [bacterium]
CALSRLKFVVDLQPLFNIIAEPTNCAPPRGPAAGSPVHCEFGGFDEEYINGYEDIDYCLKVRQKGFKIRYCPTSSLYHYQSLTEGRHNHEDLNRDGFLVRWSDYILDNFLETTDSNLQYPNSLEILTS